MAEPTRPTAGADASPGPAAEMEGPRRSRKRLLLVLPLMLLPALGGAWLAYSQYPQLASAATGLGFGQNLSESSREPIKYGQFMEIQGMIINPAGSNGKRYLMVNLGLESTRTDVLEELEEKDVVVRDTILKILGQHTVEELADIGRRNELKQELRSAVNAVLHKGRVERMYFTQYVLQ